MGGFAEVGAHDSKACRGITEACGNQAWGEPVDEVGAEGIVLPMGGVGWIEEDGSELHYFSRLSVELFSTISLDSLFVNSMFNYF